MKPLIIHITMHKAAKRILSSILWNRTQGLLSQNTCLHTLFWTPVFLHLWASTGLGIYCHHSEFVITTKHEPVCVIFTLQFMLNAGMIIMAASFAFIKPTLAFCPTTTWDASATAFTHLSTARVWLGISSTIGKMLSFILLEAPKKGKTGGSLDVILLWSVYTI